LKQLRQEPVKGNPTAQLLQVNAFLPGNILKSVLQCFERLRLSRTSWAPSGGYSLKQISQLLTFSETFPGLCDFASANEPSP
jgi:hypothetical protein